MTPKNGRMYAVLDIKEMSDGDKRLISGIASTPELDRYGDIVDPMGAKFAPEIPLLWQHQHDKPVGNVQLGKANKRGIPFKATIAKIADIGPLRDLVDMAWQSVKEKLVRGVSIGFKALQYDIMSEGGIRFNEIEIYELSLVTIPANASATIQTIKALDAGYGSRRINGGIPIMQIARQVPQRCNEDGSFRLID